MDEHTAAEELKRLGSQIEDLVNHAAWVMIDRRDNGQTFITTRLWSGRVAWGVGTFVSGAMDDLMEKRGPQ